VRRQEPSDRTERSERSRAEARAEAVLRARAISGEYGEYPGRYVGFERGDCRTFLRAHSDPEPFHKGLVSQSGGYVVNRWDVSGERLPSYVRFDDKVPVYRCQRRHPHPGECRPKRRMTRYVYPGAAVLDGSSAKRIDTHPLVRERLVSVRRPLEPVYLCLEGCLKADALASFGKLAVSVPSVTLWRVSEEDLEPYLPILRSAPVVYLVPDSDYNRRPWNRHDGCPLFVNANVHYQTDRAVAFYRAHGVRALFLVPPYLSRDLSRALGIGPGARFKQGIDDHLAHGGNLDRWDRGSNPLGVHAWEYGRPVGLWLPSLPRRRKDRALTRDTAFLVWLLETHGDVGLFEPGDAAEALGVSVKSVQRAWHSLEERGLLLVWPGATRASDGGFYEAPHIFRYSVRPGLMPV